MVSIKFDSNIISISLFITCPFTYVYKIIYKTRTTIDFLYSKIELNSHQYFVLIGENLIMYNKIFHAAVFIMDQMIEKQTTIFINVLNF